MQLKLKKRKKPKILTVKQAAAKLNIAEQRLRTLLQQKALDIGFATKTPRGYFSYTIYAHKVDKYLGVDQEN